MSSPRPNAAVGTKPAKDAPPQTGGIASVGAAGDVGGSFLQQAHAFSSDLYAATVQEAGAGSEEAEGRRRERLLRFILAEACVVLTLLMLLLVVTPFFQTRYDYFSVPEGRPREVRALVPLFLPNLTQQALLSWSIKAVTQIMTYNFANYNEKISAQRNRFLEESWKNFVTALYRNEAMEKFVDQQLVLTTAPSGTPVIISEGIVEERYQWVIQVPVVMTYVTNNNKSTQSRATVEMTIVRVSTFDNPDGIAIKTWRAQ